MMTSPDVNLLEHLLRKAREHETYGPEDEDPAYLAFLAEQEAMCGVSITMGPRHDPYGASCEVIGEHVMRNGQRIHSMQGDPFGNREGTFRWLGGGTAAGDALSFQILND